MTKIYLVCGWKVNQLGKIINVNEYHVDKVFTNYKLARNCAEWLNEEWRKGIRQMPSPKKKWFYYSVITRLIVKIDYKGIPF